MNFNITCFCLCHLTGSTRMFFWAIRLRFWNVIYILVRAFCWRANGFIIYDTTRYKILEFSITSTILQGNTNSCMQIIVATARTFLMVKYHEPGQYNWSRITNRCMQKFRNHCKAQQFNYTSEMTNCIPNKNYKINKTAVRMRTNNLKLP